LNGKVSELNNLPIKATFSSEPRYEHRLSE
jgi:hypothetical protein